MAAASAPNTAPQLMTVTAPGPPRVRAVAKINGSADELQDRAVSVTKPDGEESRRVTLTFGDQSASRYELDFCYEKHQKNSVVFEREVKPLVYQVFEGRNATIIATGANGGGKSHLIQGDAEDPGLITLAVSEMVQMAENNKKTISISLYEASSDRVLNLLGPTRQEVLIRGDTHGKIQLKGLSQVAVTSVSEFQKLLEKVAYKSKPIQKITEEPPFRNHVGLIIYVLDLNQRIVGKMNFVELAGYEDLRRMNRDGSSWSEITKINRSIHALHNVLHSLSVNEVHVPYRETKLTHMLQDSLGGTSRILIITCLNQSFCHDSICMVSLASRSRQNSVKAAPSSMKKHGNMVSPCQKPVKEPLSSLRTPISISRSTFDSRKNQVIGSASTTSKKQNLSGIHSAKKAINVSSALKARKLFKEANRSISDKVSSQARSLDNISSIKSLLQEQVVSLTSSLDIIPATESLSKDQFKLCSGSVTDEKAPENENPLPESSENMEPLPVVDAFPLTSPKPKETIPLHEIACLQAGGNLTEVTPVKSSQFKEGNNIAQENNGDLLNQGVSPPISARLQELSNNLKMLCNSTPSYAKAAPGIDVTLSTEVSTDFVEPTTPEPCTRPYDNLGIASFHSPRQTFSARSSRAKESLVQEYLNVLNTASKEDLKKLKGIGEKRATYIFEMREESPEPFKQLDDLKNIGLSEKQIKRMVKGEIGELFN